MTIDRNLEQKLNLLFELNPLAAIEWDMDFRVIAWNQAAISFFGYTKEEAIGHSFMELVVPQKLHTSLEAILPSVFQQTEGSNNINENITKTGEVVICDWYNYPLTDDQGQPRGVLSIAQNITSQKQIEETLKQKKAQLRQSEKRYQILAEASPICVFYTDAQGNCTYTNDRWQNIAGLTQEEALGMGWSKNVHPEDKERLLNSWTKATTTRQPFREEYRFQLPDGRITWVIAQAMEVTDDRNTDKVVGYVGTITNITEAKVIETQLRDNEQRYQDLMAAKLLETQGFLESVLANLPVAVFAKDAQDLKMILWNRAAERLFKIKAEDILGKNNHSLFPPEQRRAFIEEDRKALNSRGTINIPEDTIRNSDGEIRILHTKKTPIFNEEGIPQSLLVISEDITERKNAEQKLREQAAILQAFVDYTPVPIALFDKEMCYLVANRSWLVDNNLVEQNIIGRSHYEVFPNIPDRWKEGHQRCLAGAIESREADPFPRADGSVDYIRWQILPWRDAQGEIGGILMYSEIVTERIKAEEERRNLAATVTDLYQKAESRATELEETLRELQRTQGQLVQSEKMSSLGQLVAGVAHEINNPVNFIYGNLTHADEYSQDLIRLMELYQKHYPNPVAEIEEEAEAVDLEFLLTDLPQLLNSMKVGADRIKEIVYSLRNFSRMDEAAMKAVDIHEGIDSTLMILQSRLKVKSNQPEIPVIKEYGELPLIECYAGELNQVFMNIITNAIDALEERDQQRTFSECQQNPSQININTTLLPDKQVEIKISDNGLGIPESVQKKLFDPFFTTKEIGKGTGLGMSISYQIITERHNGSLTCESQIGQGASFIIKIPLQQSSSGN